MYRDALQVQIEELDAQIRALQNLSRGKDTEPLTVPPVLTRQGVADLLQVSIRTVDKLPIKSTLIGKRTRRFQTKHVLEYLERFAE